MVFLEAEFLEVEALEVEVPRFGVPRSSAGDHELEHDSELPNPSLEDPFRAGFCGNSFPTGRKGVNFRRLLLLLVDASSGVINPIGL